MESNILEGLGWRVSVFLPMDFVDTMLELLSAKMPPYVHDSLIQGCKECIWIKQWVTFTFCVPEAGSGRGNGLPRRSADRVHGTLAISEARHLDESFGALQLRHFLG